MRGLLIAICFAISFSAYAKRIPAIDNNYCKDDVYNYVAYRFGPETQIIKMFRISGSSGMTHYIYFQVDACEGDIIAAFTGEGWQCTTAQHGTQRTQFLNYVYTLSESCHQYIHGDDRIDLYP